MREKLYPTLNCQEPQSFQVDAAKTVVNCFEGQAPKTNRFTLEPSKELIHKAKQAAARAIQANIDWKKK